jgi:hypothetical protein
MARTLVVSVLAVLAAAVLAGPLAAREVVLRDGEGRTIRFDVRADVDVAWYAGLLRRAAHSDEIERVTIRIVDWDELAERCGRRAAGCYGRREGNRGVMVVPAGRSAGIAHTVIHEYGHHVDWSRRHSNLDEPNGTPLWWKARGMAELVSLRSVRDRYQIGWNRSIAEVFAEDYAFTNLRRGYRISWLRPPSQTVQQAIRADLGLAERPVIAAARPDLRPVVIVRQGTLRPREGVAVDFGLLGPNRSVRLDGAFPAGGRGHVEVTCDDTTRERRLLTAARAAVMLELPRVGPAQCRASIVNTGSRAERFRFSVRLTVRR